MILLHCGRNQGHIDIYGYDVVGASTEGVSNKTKLSAIFEI